MRNASWLCVSHAFVLAVTVTTGVRNDETNDANTTNQHISDDNPNDDSPNDDSSGLHLDLELDLADLDV